MKRSCRPSFCAGAVLAAALAFAGCSNNGSSSNNSGSAPAAQPASPSTPSSASSAPAAAAITLPAGTEIHVVLDSTVSSRDARPGDTFDATVSEPVIVEGQTVVGRHARARGEVVDAQASGRLSKPAMLTLALKAVEVHGSWVSVQSRHLVMEGKSHKKRDVIAIGGGSALGALIGGIAGGGKGAAIGAAAGGGAGTAGAAATGKKDITLTTESHLTFRLERSATASTQ